MDGWKKKAEDKEEKRRREEQKEKGQVRCPGEKGSVWGDLLSLTVAGSRRNGRGWEKI